MWNAKHTFGQKMLTQDNGPHARTTNLFLSGTLGYLFESFNFHQFSHA